MSGALFVAGTCDNKNSLEFIMFLQPFEKNLFGFFFRIFVVVGNQHCQRGRENTVCIVHVLSKKSIKIILTTHRSTDYQGSIKPIDKHLKLTNLSETTNKAECTSRKLCSAKNVFVMKYSRVSYVIILNVSHGRAFLI